LNKYLKIALIGIGLLVLALVLSFAAMSGTVVHRTFNESFQLVPNVSRSLDVWAVTGAFSKNVTLTIKTDCRPLNITIIERVGGGRVVKESEVYNETVITGLDRLVAPKVVVSAHESCSASLLLSFYYVRAEYAWLSLPALLAMIVGAALLLVGGSAYTAYKIRTGRASR